MFKAVVFMMLIFAGMASGKGPDAATLARRLFPVDSLNVVRSAPDRVAASATLLAAGFVTRDSLTFERGRGTAAAEEVTLELAPDGAVESVRQQSRCGLACDDLLLHWARRYRAVAGAVAVETPQGLVLTAQDRTWQVTVAIEGREERAQMVVRSRGL